MAGSKWDDHSPPLEGRLGEASMWAVWRENMHLIDIWNVWNEQLKVRRDLHNLLSDSWYFLEFDLSDLYKSTKRWIFQIPGWPNFILKPSETFISTHPTSLTSIAILKGSYLFTKPSFWVLYPFDLTLPAVLSRWTNPIMAPRCLQRPGRYLKSGGTLI